MRFPFQRKQGPYHGRLSFDSASGFHLSDDGTRVVTEDRGKTWRYARRGDISHFERYHERTVGVEPTANVAEPEQHHYGVLADDPHAEGVLAHRDSVAPTVTSHTEAYLDA